MATLHCEIVTPEGRAFTGDVERVTVPGVLGEMGVLPRHHAVVVQLKVGETRIIVDGETQRFATGDGYFEVSGERAIVLVEEAKAQGSIDADTANAAAADARARLARADGGDESVDRFRAERDLAYAENELKVKSR